MIVVEVSDRTLRTALGRLAEQTAHQRHNPCHGSRGIQMAAGDRQSGTDAVGRGQQFGHDDNFPGASQGADPGRKQIGNDMRQINVGKGSARSRMRTATGASFLQPGTD